MRTIHKFTINVDSNIIHIRSHQIVQWLIVQEQHGSAQIWAIVDPDTNIETREILVRGTGHPFTGIEDQYIGTFQEAGGQLVWHLFTSSGAIS